MHPDVLKTKIFSVSSDKDFNALALEIFHFQYRNNYIYKRFIDLLGINTETITRWQQIPFLPVEFYKNYKIVCGNFKPDLIFRSSGTTTSERSTHYVFSKTLYEESIYKSFTIFYGDLQDYRIFALCPDLQNSPESSLAYMLDFLIKKSQHSDSGFYYHKEQDLFNKLKSNNKEKTIVFGLTYALLDFAEKYSFPLENVIFIETGGMKGRRKEMIRKEVHDILKNKFQLQNVHSEYSMCELMSQAYSLADGIFRTPPWMKVVVSDIHDRQSLIGNNLSGQINIIDLANFMTCSFIATSDIGKTFDDGSFEVSGRFDFSDLRGCSLMGM